MDFNVIGCEFEANAVKAILTKRYFLIVCVQIVRLLTNICIVGFLQRLLSFERTVKVSYTTTKLSVERE